MDIHTRIAAVLHIVTGTIGVAVMLIGAISMQALPNFLSGNAGSANEVGLIFGFGTLVMAVFALLLCAEIIAGVALLRGSSTGRVFVIVFGALGLFNFPVGTAIGVYTLWALLRKQPKVEAAKGGSSRHCILG